MLAGLCLCMLQTALPKLPPNQSIALREALAEALAAPGSNAESDLKALAKKLDSQYEFASLIEGLRQGPKLPSGDPKPRKVGKAKEKFTQIGPATFGLSFESGGQLFTYAVEVPSGYDPKQPRALLIDPGHGTGQGKSPQEKADFLPYFRNHAESGALAGCLLARTDILELVGADGVRGALPEDEVAAIFDAFFRDLVSRYAVDLERVYVAGISQTGFWAWYLARARADRLAGIAPLAAVTWQVNAYESNMEHVPVYVVHAQGDPVCPVAQPRATTESLKKLGFNVKYVELPGGEHSSAFPRLGEGLDWLAKKKRQRYPKSFAVQLLSDSTPWWYWVRVQGLKASGKGRAMDPPKAHLRASIEGQTITLESKHVKAVDLLLARELVDLDKPIVVVWNGTEVHSGLVERDFAAVVEIAVERADWGATCEAILPLKAPSGS